MSRLNDLIADRELLTSLRSRGFSVREDAGQLMIAPASQLSLADRDFIRERRLGLLCELSAEAAWEALEPCHKTEIDSRPSEVKAAEQRR